MDALFPPGPQKSLLLGDAPHFNEAPLAYMLSASRTYGPIVHFRFGPSHAYLLTNPRDAHEVLVERVSEFDEKHSLVRALNSAMGHDLFPPKDKPSKQRLEHGVFDAAWMTGKAGEIARVTAEALRGWHSGDPLPMLNELALHITTQALFDSDDAQQREFTQRLADSIYAARDDRSFQSPLMPPLWIPTTQNRRRQHASAELRRISLHLLAEHQANPRNGIFAQLLRHVSDPANAVQEMLALVFAGTEALAHTLAWSFYLLAKSPTSRDSIDSEVAAQSAPTDDLPYTEMVLKETMRLYPPVWLVSRQAKRETRIGDYYVPSGSTIFVSPYVIHHNQRYFTSPETFLPERYGESLMRRSSGFADLPFGAGRYAAAEQDFMLTLAKPILATVVQHIDIGLEPSAKVVAEPKLSLRPVGLKLRLDQRVAAV